MNVQIKGLPTNLPSANPELASPRGLEPRYQKNSREDNLISDETMRIYARHVYEHLREEREDNLISDETMRIYARYVYEHLREEFEIDPARVRLVSGAEPSKLH